MLHRNEVLFIHSRFVHTWTVPLTRRGSVEKCKPRSYMDIPFAYVVPFRRYSLADVVHLCRPRSHVAVQYTCGGPFTCGRSIYRWRSCSQMQFLITYGRPVHKWRFLSHMRIPLTRGGPVYTSQAQSPFNRGLSVRLWRSLAYLDNQTACPVLRAGSLKNTGPAKVSI